MELFNCLKLIYNKNNLEILNEYNSNELPQPYLILKWLSMDKRFKEELNYLNKFTFILEPKEFILLCYSIIPKALFKYNKYIKSNKEKEQEYKEFIYYYRKFFEMSDNDFNESKNFIFNHIENNKLDWLISCGIKRNEYKKYGLGGLNK